MGDQSYPTLRLSQRLGEQWPNIEAARQLSDQWHGKLADCLADLDSEDTSIVVLGSLGRGEFTPHSDIDWYLLVDGIADPHHHKLFLEADKRIKAVTPKDVGKEKTFASFVSSHNLIQIIGGEEDTNNNLTRRVLLLLESRPLVGQVTHERVMKNILKRYLLEDESFWRVNSHHIPHFLLNDFGRFGRTVAVDFAYKLRARSTDEWALRNIKLRMSRKLLYVVGLLVCFHSQLTKDANIQPNLYEDEENRPAIVEMIYSIISDRPLDIVAWLSSAIEEDAAVLELFKAYDKFLKLMFDAGKRAHLEEISEIEAESDSCFQNAREISHHFRTAVLDLFFGDRLYELTRLYGVF